MIDRRHHPDRPRALGGQGARQRGLRPRLRGARSQGALPRRLQPHRGHGKRDFNRHVRKDERGIGILVPIHVKCREKDEQNADEERRRLVDFRVSHVFDVSQTESEPLLTLVDKVSGRVSRITGSQLPRTARLER